MSDSERMPVTLKTLSGLAPLAAGLLLGFSHIPAAPVIRLDDLVCLPVCSFSNILDPLAILNSAHLQILAVDIRGYEKLYGEHLTIRIAMLFSLITALCSQKISA